MNTPRKQMQFRTLTHVLAAALLFGAAACAADPSWETADGMAFDDGKADGFAGTYEGVAFTVEEARATLTLVNTAERDVLDEQAGAGSRAATSIVGARPLATVAQLAAVPQVGTATLTKLKDFAARWTRALPTGPQCGAGGRFDGVTFTGEQECRALDIVNTAGYLQLSQVDSLPRRTVYDRRPWRSLRDVAAAYGVGSDAMGTLQAMSGEWVIGTSGHLDTVESVLRERPQVMGGRVPQITIDRGRVAGRVAGTPCLWIADADVKADTAQRMQLCVPADFKGSEALFQQALAAPMVVKVRASFRQRSTGAPYLLAFATDFLRITSELLP